MPPTLDLLNPKIYLNHKFPGVYTIELFLMKLIHCFDIHTKCIQVEVTHYKPQALAIQPHNVHFYRILRSLLFCTFQ